MEPALSAWDVLALLAAAHLAAAMSPGANTLLVLRAAGLGRREGLVAAAGFWPAGVLWSAAGLAGLGAVIAALPWIETALRVVCGLYLAWIGLGMIRGSLVPRVATDDAGQRISLRRLYLEGFLTNLSNPKSIAYFTSVFAATGAFTLPLPMQVVAVLLLPTIGFCWYGLLALTASSAPTRRLIAGSGPWLQRIAGTVMIALGVRLLVQR